MGRARASSDALFKNEREILALYDKGLGPDHITARTGYSRARVMEVIGKLSGAPDNTMRDDFIAGSARMIEMFRTAHPERFA